MTTPTPDLAEQPSDSTQGTSRWLRTLLLCSLATGLLFAAAQWAPSASTGWLVASVFVLAMPALLGAWHRGLNHKAIAAQQFRSDGTFHWLATRRFFVRPRGVVLAFALAAAALVVCVGFDAQQWAIVFLMPLAFATVRGALDPWVGRQYSRRAFGRQGQARVAGWMVVVAFWAAYVALLLVSPPTLDAPGLAERVNDLQTRWQDAPSALLRWALDGLAWINATDAALAQAVDDRNWRLALSLVAAPLVVATYLALAFHGITLNRAELRRVLGPGLSAEDEPEPVGPMHAGFWSAAAVVALSILVIAIGALDRQIKDEPSPWKLIRLPDCEAIAGKVYKLGTWERLQELTGESLRASETGRAAYCSAVKQARQAAAAPVDLYLDWYFSLGAELQRSLSIFSGNTDQMLQSKLKEMLDADPGFRSLVDHISSTGNASLRTADDLGGLRGAILKDNVIIGDEQQCRVVRHEATLPGHQELFDLRAHGATVSGLTVGAVTGAIAAKAMTKAVMKSAAKVVAKIIAKQGIKSAAGIAAPALSGAAIGAAIPVVGPVVGALIGGAIGLVTTVGVDVALLAAEEKLTREDMKRELLDAVQEGVAGSVKGLDCPR